MRNGTTVERNIYEIKQVVTSILQRSRHSIIVLLDADRTLISEDSTRHFFRYLNLDFGELKAIFQLHGYSLQAFWRAAHYYSDCTDEVQYDEACDYASRSVTVYPAFLKFFAAIRDSAEIIVVTSGIQRVWHRVLLAHDLDYIHLIGGNHFATDSYVVDQYAKGAVVHAIKQHSNRRVIAFGDSLIDLAMLQMADYSVCVVNERQNLDLSNHFQSIAHLRQLSFNKFYHPQIPAISLNELAGQITLG